MLTSVYMYKPKENLTFVQKIKFSRFLWSNMLWMTTVTVFLPDIHVDWCIYTLFHKTCCCFCSVNTCCWCSWSGKYVLLVGWPRKFRETKFRGISCYFYFVFSRKFWENFAEWDIRHKIFVSGKVSGTSSLINSFYEHEYTQIMCNGDSSLNYRQGQIRSWETSGHRGQQKG